MIYSFSPESRCPFSSTGHHTNRGFALIGQSITSSCAGGCEVNENWRRGFHSTVPRPQREAVSTAAPNTSIGITRATEERSASGENCNIQRRQRNEKASTRISNVGKTTMRVENTEHEQEKEAREQNRGCVHLRGLTMS